MDLSQFLNVAAGLLDGFIALAKLKDPTADDAALAAEVSGDLKHLLRGKVGFFVDIFWGYIEPDINKLIESRLSATPDTLNAGTTPKEVTA